MSSFWHLSGRNLNLELRKCSPIQRALLLFALRPDSTVGALMTVVQELKYIFSKVKPMVWRCLKILWNAKVWVWIEGALFFNWWIVIELLWFKKKHAFPILSRYLHLLIRRNWEPSSLSHHHWTCLFATKTQVHAFRASASCFGFWTDIEIIEIWTWMKFGMISSYQIQIFPGSSTFSHLEVIPWRTSRSWRKRRLLTVNLYREVTTNAQ